MPLIAGETKVIVFSDFDGTITLNDSNGMKLHLFCTLELNGD